MFSKQVGQRLQEVVELAQEEVRRGRQGSLMTMDLEAMEEVATAVGDEFARSLLRALLGRQAEEAEGCSRTCPVCRSPLEEKPRQTQPLKTRRGRLAWKQPVRYCPTCRRDFFPQAAALGCEVDQQESPAVQRKIVEAAVQSRSYDKGSRMLRKLAELEVSAKQCERVTQRIGRERLAERQQRLVHYERLPLPQQQHGKPEQVPEGFWRRRAAVIEVDGGRLQMRDERWGQPPQREEGRRRWWRESKAACLATFLSTPSQHDPLPEIPACLLDPLFAVPLFSGIHRPGRTDPSRADAGEPPPLAASQPEPSAQRWSPPPLVRSVPATCLPYEELGRLVAAEAWQRGFAAADRKAYLANGHSANWSLHERFFSHYVGIADLMHALSYVYAAAVAGSTDMQAAWQRYSRWAQRVWQGQVLEILPDLEALLAGRSHPMAAESVGTALNYLRNNAPHMRYDEYRKQGFPVTTAHMESTIKQLNLGVKGTEKFGNAAGAEPLLQLCADTLSQTDPLAGFWRRRAACQTGFRKRRTRT